MDLYKTIAWELGLPTERNRAALFKHIRTEVSRLCAENRLRPILIVDEAHHLRTDVLEDLRLLTNYAMDSENRLCVILVGHPELRRRLGMSALEALAQRIVVRAHVRGVTRDEIGPYLEHRLRLAGCELALFEPSTVEAIYQASNALPRKVNLLAHHALFAAAIAKAKSVTTEHVPGRAPGSRVAAPRPSPREAGRSQDRAGLSRSVPGSASAETIKQTGRSSRWGSRKSVGASRWEQRERRHSRSAEPPGALTVKSTTRLFRFSVTMSSS